MVHVELNSQIQVPDVSPSQKKKKFQMYHDFNMLSSID